MIRTIQLPAKRFITTTARRGHPVLELTFPRRIRDSACKDSLEKPISTSSSNTESTFGDIRSTGAISTGTIPTSVKETAKPERNIITIPKPDGTTLLERIGQHHVSVTGLIPKYCEVRYYYDLIFDVRYESKMLERGTRIHEVLERQQNQEIEDVLRIIETLPTKVVNRDRVFESIVRILELVRNGSVRELYLQGIIPYGDGKNVLVSGIIDKLHLDKNGEVVITDTKTRASKTAVPTQESIQNAKFQTFIYRQMLDNLVLGKFSHETWNAHHGDFDLDSVDFTTELGSAVKKPLEDTLIMMAHNKARVNNLTHMESLRKKYADAWSIASFQSLLSDLYRMIIPTVSTQTEVEFMYQNARNDEIRTISHHQFTFDRALMNEVVEFSMEFWDYRRPSLGVQSSQYARCTNCHWKNQCEWKFKLDHNLL